jgi:hypothetical protein
VAGCGSGTSSSEKPTVDPEKAEALVVKAAREQVHLRPRSVSCPDDIAGKKGATFTCRVTGADGTTATVPGRVTGTENGGRIFVGMPLVDVGKIEATMVTFLRNQVGPSAKVACPDVVTLRKGGTFTCRATAGQGQNADVVATISSAAGAKGDITFKVVPVS